MREIRRYRRAAARLAVPLAALALLVSPAAAAPEVVLPHDLEAALDQLEDLGGFFGAFAARETNDFAQERWRRLSLGYPGTAAILRDFLARDVLRLDDLPDGRVSAILDRGEIVIDRDLDGRWQPGLVPPGPAGEAETAAQRRDLLLPALFEALARRQPPQDWPWLADHLRAVGGFGALAQDPVARPLLARFFHAKDSYLWLAMQRIGEGSPAARRDLAARQAAAVNAVRALESAMAATFGPKPAARLQDDWADYVAQVDGFAVTRGWLLLDPALRQTHLGVAARRDAGAVRQAAAEAMSAAPRSALAAARSGATPATRPEPATRSEPPAGPPTQPLKLDSLVAGITPPASAPVPVLPFLTQAPEAIEPPLSAAAFRAFAASIKEAAEQGAQEAVAAQAEQLGAARAEVATLEAKLDALLAAMEQRASEAAHLEAALAAERERRQAAEAAQEKAEAEAAREKAEAEAAREKAETEAARENAVAEAAREKAVAEAARRSAETAPPIAVAPPSTAAGSDGALSDFRFYYGLAGLGALILFVAFVALRARRRPAAPPLLLAAPAAEPVRPAVEAAAPAQEERAAAPAQEAQPEPAPARVAAAASGGLRVNGVTPPTAAARAAMKAASARQEAARAADASPAAEAGSEADTAANPIVQALRRGNLPLFELLFSELTALRAPQLQRIVYGGRGEDLAIVCRAVGVDKLLFGSIFMLTDHLRGGDADEEPERTAEMLRMYDRMPPATARKVLAKWQSNWSGAGGREPVADV